jgi:hypothetical protein
MALTTILLIPGDSGWQIGISIPETSPTAPHAAQQPALHPLDFPADASPELAAAQIASHLQASGCPGEDVILAIPGSWCLSAGFTLAANRPRRHETLSLRLEEQLPIPAEEFVADFVHCGDQVLGIAGRLELLAPVITALESQQVHIANVIPLSLLGLQNLAAGLRNVSACILWQYAHQVDVMCLRQGRLTHWSVVPAEVRSLAAELSRLALDGPAEETRCDLDAALTQSLQAEGWMLTRFHRAMPVAALATANQIAAGMVPPLIDLRRGTLAAPDPLRRLRGSLNATLVAAMVFLCVAASAMLVRSSRYQQVVAQSEARQAVVFQQAFPNAAVPVNIKARLEAEYRSVGTSGAPSTTASAPAILLLRDLLSHLPSSAKVELTRVVIRGNHFRVEGSVAAADQATTIWDAIATATSTKLEPLSLVPLPNGACSLVLQSLGPTPTTAPATAAPEAP